jgi:sigma-E factor negative regulatory protein RseB
MQMRSVSLALAVLCTVAPAALAASSEEARAWIQRMNDAVVNRNYDGVLEHRWDGGREREGLRIIHRMKDQQMSERVVFFDSNNEFVRTGSQLLEYYHGKRTVRVQELNRSFGYISAFNGISAETDKFYEIRNGGTQSLKDYPGRTQMISLEPRDEYRYGYRFWLDRNSAMPIKTQLVSNGVVLDEIFFQSLSMPESIDDAMLKPSANIKGYTWRKDAPAKAVNGTFGPRDDLLPRGFRVLNPRLPGATEARTPATRFLVSDGIAWVSVFVSVADESQGQGPGKAAGAGTFAHVHRVNGHDITAVGGVPPATVKKIAEAVRPE